MKFFDWAFTNGDKLALDLDYVPLPEPVKAQVRASWKGMTDNTASRCSDRGSLRFQCLR